VVAERFIGDRDRRRRGERHWSTHDRIPHALLLPRRPRFPRVIGPTSMTEVACSGRAVVPAVAGSNPLAHPRGGVPRLQARRHQAHTRAGPQPRPRPWALTCRSSNAAAALSRSPDAPAASSPSTTSATPASPSSRPCACVRARSTGVASRAYIQQRPPAAKWARLALIGPTTSPAVQTLTRISRSGFKCRWSRSPSPRREFGHVSPALGSVASPSSRLRGAASLRPNSASAGRIGWRHSPRRNTRAARPDATGRSQRRE
jgi:hypothetical protein